MDFIKILGDVITEQINVQAGHVGANAGQQASQTWSQVTPHRWKPGTKLGPVLKKTGVCNNYEQDRGVQRGIHKACDIPTRVGTGVFAPYDGEFKIYETAACGNGIQIIGINENGDRMLSTFCHLRSREVPSDGKVTKGQLIGFTGGERGEAGSGRSDGPHLHWAFSVAGIPTNPYTYN